MADERPLRGCDRCGAVDDHPRVIHVVPPDFPGAVPSDEMIDKLSANGIGGAALRMILDPLTIIRHHDCCAQAGCPDGICRTVLEGAEGKTGNDLLKHIQKGK